MKGSGQWLVASGQWLVDISRRVVALVGFALMLANAADCTSVIVTSPDVRYPIQAASVREVDFKNLSYKLGKSNSWFQLRDGICTKEYGDGVREPHSMEEVSLYEVSYFDLDQKGKPQHALVVLNYLTIAGSSSEEGVIQVFGIRNDRLVMIQQFAYDRQAPGTGETFDRAAGVLTVTARTDDQSAHCCPKSIDIVSYRWIVDRRGIST